MSAMQFKGSIKGRELPAMDEFDAVPVGAAPYALKSNYSFMANKAHQSSLAAQRH